MSKYQPVNPPKTVFPGIKEVTRKPVSDYAQDSIKVKAIHPMALFFLPRVAPVRIFIPDVFFSQ
jgi:hypothetical protein